MTGSLGRMEEEEELKPFVNDFLMSGKDVP